MRGQFCAAASLAALLTVGASPLLALSLTLSSSYDHPTAKVKVSGSGFGANAAIDVYFDTTDEMVVVADANGKFAKHTIQVPASAAPGEHWISAVERDNGQGVQKLFTVSTDWTELGFDSRNRRNNPWENVISTGNVATLDTMWSRKTGDVIQSSPAVANGIAYITSDDDSLYAIDVTTGTPLWTFAADTSIITSPATAGGTVYFASTSQGFQEGQLYAIDAATGALKWNAGTGEAAASPAVVDGTVYFAAESGVVFAFDAATGTQRWAQNLGATVEASPAVSDGAVYIVTETNPGNNISALDAATGTVLWQNTTRNPSNSTPTLSGGSLWIVSSTNSGPYVLSRFRAADGGTETILNLGASGGSETVEPAPAVANGTVYVSISGQVMAVRPNGKNLSTLWTVNLDPGILPTAPAIADGVVYIGAGDDGIFLALDSSTGNTLWSGTTAGAFNLSSPAVSNGQVFIGGDKRLFAFALNGGDNAVYRRRHIQPPTFASLHPNFRLKPVP